MKFRTEITAEPHPGLLTHEAPVMLLGSCFSDHMARRLQARGFNVIASPFGTLYNPLSLLGALKRLRSGEPFGPESLTLHQGVWHSLMHHSSFSRRDPEAALQAINTALAYARRALAGASAVFVTLGTTRVFTHRPSGLVAANCHKLPATLFEERSIGVDEAAAALRGCINLVAELAPQAACVFTVSPVRHLASGLEGNSLSKATLRVAAHIASGGCPGALYFPAFEALVDDLRDYRFYNPDMKHPTEQAADYVYSLLEDAYMTAATRQRAADAWRLHLKSLHRDVLH